MDLVAPAITALILYAVATVIGLYPVRRMIEVREARHKLRRGSAGWIRTLAGWSVILLWSFGVWVAATIIGDWARTGDLELALERGAWRLRLLLEILAALGSE